MDLLVSGIDPVVFWLLGGAITTIAAVLWAVAMLSRRLDRLDEDLKALRKLGISLPRIDPSQSDSAASVPSESRASQDSSDVKLHLSQVKRQQIVLAERLAKISTALSELRSLPSALEELKDEQARLLEAVVTISAELEDWIARFDDTSSELTHLLESEPVVEFQNSLDTK